MDCILLDPDNYNPNTHAWNAPILDLPRVKCVNLYIDGREVSQNEYNVKKNYIYISEKNTITAHTKAYVMIDVSSGPSILVKFWLPIILGLLTAFSPLIPGLRINWLHSNSMLTYSFDPKMNYDTLNRNFKFKIGIGINGIPMTQEQTQNYKLILLMKGAENAAIPPDKVTFCCLSDPFKLEGNISGYVKSDSNLIDNILQKNIGMVQVVMVLIKKERIQEVRENLTLGSIPGEDYKLVGTGVLNISTGEFIPTS